MANRIAKYDLRNRIAGYAQESEQVEYFGNEIKHTIIRSDVQIIGWSEGNQRSIMLQCGREQWAWIYHVTEHDLNIKNWTQLAGDPASDINYYHAALLCKVARQIR